MDAEIVLGPVLLVESGEFLIPSPRYNQNAIAQWKPLGGRFERRNRKDYWLVANSRAGWLEVDTLYRQYFAWDVRQAQARLRGSNPLLFREIEHRLSRQTAACSQRKE
jgi:hypothetical protein